jgi:hypothetical protein
MSLLKNKRLTAVTKIELKKFNKKLGAITRKKYTLRSWITTVKKTFVVMAPSYQ